jgi:Flp pilus assembly protein TadG
MATATAARHKSYQTARHLLSQRRAHGESGSVIIETALSAVILLTFVFGIMEVGLAGYSYHFTSEAAREGSRFAIVRGSSCVQPSDFTSACPASSTDIQNYVKNLGFPGINPANMTVAPSWSAYPVGTTCISAPIPCSSPGDLVTVKVTYTFPFSIPFVPSSTLTMTSTSAMVISQ